MFEKQVPKATKRQVTVRLCLTDGRTVEGELFLGQTERLSDTLNDGRAFLPVETALGTQLVAKAVIGTAVALAEPAGPEAQRDPYAILRVPPTATDAELRDAWMRAVKASHPDRLQAMALDPVIVHAARRVCQRFNAAYDEAARARKTARTAKAA